MTGKIIKGIGGFYYVVCENGITYECKAKGVFRNRKIKPLVGDNVEIEILDEEKNLGNIEDILPRFNWLNRPAVANVDQTVIIFAVSAPAPNFNLLDRFLINMEQHEVPTVICFNKVDLEGFRQSEDICRSYTKSGYEVLFISAESGYGIDVLEAVIKGKTTVFAGPSGVGKSSTLNSLFPDANVQTGGLSEKIQRGKHTTRHSELMFVDDDTYIMDTPGFSSLYTEEIEAEDLKLYFPEIAAYTGTCKFNMCNHISEPGCLVKKAVSDGRISKMRYDDYVMIYNELKEKRKW
ncbi:ribosome small subunit-dependent GTPase A [Clostridium sp. OM05-9]|jgi:ribosome small subunit-dependent GTPase A|uniref:Small ribosomal subunit biogenesis GTPase RsgA n=1 Tax=Coprococcus hominis (ex Liu et al. 2022) TaxID=2763039 RepID=A0A8I0AF11_9FIRM|nr:MULTISPECIES: ribosome small subunit-dependent GTPase A [Clostridia]HAB88611.1 ribosome small subunit-dependent GTPase A [Coprococcus sp.]MBC5662683.1 ribosome small subunit-dependent GTPase A [Coprococcus hominis (ex Liu et al. 2022)]RGG78843.1 ribosome small subunit-dependent GTPase A [Clostridium sp. AF17-21AC]RHR59416.1 ribosome small subunit-dependent GTPase A [Clostridium sp. AF17-2]RHV12650.1 ribosome small subunit-dependent GTPase A [Clostridium sp. OM05-9]